MQKINYYRDLKKFSYEAISAQDCPQLRNSKNPQNDKR